VTQVVVPKTPLPAPYTRWGDWMLGYPGLVLLLAVMLGASNAYYRQRAVKPVTVTPIKE
jgi:hypothetical protein